MRIKRIFIIILLSIILFNFPACNKLENLTDSASKLLVLSITGTDLDGTDGSTTIFSDVYREGEGVFNDTAVAEVNAVLLDPSQSSGTYYQDIIIDQVDVKYTRSDMANAQEGVDVPFGFSQKVYVLVGIGDTVDVPFILVQHVAKIESPLVELLGIDNIYGQEKILKLEAQCTFYGRDVAGNRIAPVTGFVSIWCADFGDN